MKGLVRSRPDPFVSALPIFPGRRQPSIFGASELNCRVRDGNGWTLTAISTDFVDTSSISFASAFGENSLISLCLLSLANPLLWISLGLSISTALTVKIFSVPPERFHSRGSGTPSGTRTLDTLIKSQVLYQLS